MLADIAATTNQPDLAAQLCDQFARDNEYILDIYAELVFKYLYACLDTLITTHPKAAIKIAIRFANKYGFTNVPEAQHINTTHHRGINIQLCCYVANKLADSNHPDAAVCLLNPEFASRARYHGSYIAKYFGRHPNKFATHITKINDQDTLHALARDFAEQPNTLPQLMVLAEHIESRDAIGHYMILTLNETQTIEAFRIADRLIDRYQLRDYTYTVIQSAVEYLKAMQPFNATVAGELLNLCQQQNAALQRLSDTAYDGCKFHKRWSHKHFKELSKLIADKTKPTSQKSQPPSPPPPAKSEQKAESKLPGNMSPITPPPPQRKSPVQPKPKSPVRLKPKSPVRPKPKSPVQPKSKSPIRPKPKPTQQSQVRLSNRQAQMLWDKIVNPTSKTARINLSKLKKTLTNLRQDLAFLGRPTNDSDTTNAQQNARCKLFDLRNHVTLLINKLDAIDSIQNRASSTTDQQKNQVIAAFAQQLQTTYQALEACLKPRQGNGPREVDAPIKHVLNNNKITERIRTALKWTYKLLTLFLIPLPRRLRTPSKRMILNTYNALTKIEHKPASPEAPSTPGTGPTTPGV